MERSSGGLWAEPYNGSGKYGIPLQLASTPRGSARCNSGAHVTVHLVISLLLLLLLFLLLLLLLQ